MSSGRLRGPARPESSAIHPSPRDIVSRGRADNPVPRRFPGRLRACVGLQVAGGELQQLRRWVPIVLLVTGTRLPAQSAVTIPASSALYDRLESVSALFPVAGVFLGERPLSRREVL